MIREMKAFYDITGNVLNFVYPVAAGDIKAYSNIGIKKRIDTPNDITFMVIDYQPPSKIENEITSKKEFQKLYKELLDNLNNRRKKMLISELLIGTYNP